MISRALFTRYYPDERCNGTVAFYSWIRAELQAPMRLLNIGAGPATNSRIRNLRGEASRVVGIDVDPVVFENQELDEARLIVDGTFPFPEETFDLAYADFVLEHVDKPGPFFRETARVLKKGGKFFFRTPNRYHYVALGSAITPHSLHRLVANRMRGLSPDAHEPWLVRYRANSRSAIRTLARQAGYASVEMKMVEAEPSYLVFHPALFMLGVAYERLVNSSDLFAIIRANIFGKLVK